MDKISARKEKVKNWYLDMSLLANYWGQNRAYHHTAPVNALYGLHEALVMLSEEGIEAAWARHRRNHLALKAGLEALGHDTDAILSRAPISRAQLADADLADRVHGLAVLQAGFLDRLAVEVGAVGALQVAHAPALAVVVDLALQPQPGQRQRGQAMPRAHVDVEHQTAQLVAGGGHNPI